MELLKVVYYGLLVCSLLSLLFNIKRLPAYNVWFIPIIGLGLLVQLASDVLEGSGINSLFLFHVYQPVECFLLLCFYRQLLSIQTKWLAGFFFVLYLVTLAIYYAQKPASFHTWDFFDFTIEAMIVCFFVVLFFLQILRNQQKTDLKHFTGFWLNASHLIFYGGCLFVMGLYYYIKKLDPQLARQVLKINHFLNLFLYSAYSIVFICSATSRKSYL